MLSAIWCNMSCLWLFCTCGLGRNCFGALVVSRKKNAGDASLKRFLAVAWLSRQYFCCIFTWDGLRRRGLAQEFSKWHLKSMRTWTTKMMPVRNPHVYLGRGLQHCHCPLVEYHTSLPLWHAGHGVRWFILRFVISDALRFLVKLAFESVWNFDGLLLPGPQLPCRFLTLSLTYW